MRAAAGDRGTEEFQVAAHGVGRGLVLGLRLSCFAEGMPCAIPEGGGIRGREGAHLAGERNERVEPHHEVRDQTRRAPMLSARGSLHAEPRDLLRHPPPEVCDAWREVAQVAGHGGGVEPGGGVGLASRTESGAHQPTR